MLRSKVCALEWQGMKRICLGSRQAGTKCWRLISAYMWDCRFAFTAGSMVQSGSCRVSNRVFPRRLTVSGNKVLALKCKKKKRILWLIESCLICPSLGEQKHWCAKHQCLFVAGCKFLQMAFFAAAFIASCVWRVLAGTWFSILHLVLFGKLGDCNYC